MSDDDNKVPVPTDTNPDNSKEQMKEQTAQQFDKLLEHNKALYEESRKKIEENEELKRKLQTLEVKEPKDEAKEDELKSIADLVKTDEKTGEKYLDPIGLAKRIEDLTAKAEKPGKEFENFKSEQEKQQIEEQKREAFTAYPTLDPRNEKFDKEFMKEVRMAMSDSIRFSEDYGGRALGLREAADWVNKKQAKETPEVKPNPKEELVEPNTQAPSERRTISTDDFGRLREQTRYGNTDALMSRLESIKDSYTEKIVE